jgi:hypothetical protein
MRSPGALAALALLATSLAQVAVAQTPVSAQSRVESWKYEWTLTDFSKHAVDLSEIISGGPPRDGIPPIDRPKFVPPGEAAQWLGAEEPVMVYRHGGEAKAYPLQILIWHEIVNDTVGGKPVVITFCPLCNSALVFDRRVKGRVLDFGTTGKLRNSDLVMWDRQTESWWQQLTGEGIVGLYTGTQLTFLPSAMVSFTTFRENFPKGAVLSRETGHPRDYGANPYAGYDNPGNQPFLMRDPVSKRLPAMERVVAVEFGKDVRAYPFTELRKVGVLNQSVGEEDFVIFFRGGTRSALDGRDIATSRDVGTAVVYSRRVGKRRLTFERKGDTLVDKETGSRWNLVGEGVSGPLKGQRLTPLVHAQHFAFAWLAFRPDSVIWKAP